MADSNAFTTLCEKLEQSSTLDRLEARGTVRLSLKQAGLEAASVSASQLVDPVLFGAHGFSSSLAMAAKASRCAEGVGILVAIE